VDLTGKRVAVIGTGASGVQVVQEIASVVSHLTVYQRTPNLAIPMQQATIQDQRNWKFPSPDEYQKIFDATRQNFFGMDSNPINLNTMDVPPDERRQLFEELYKQGGFSFVLGNYHDVLMSREANNEIYTFWKEKTRARINDPLKKKKP